MVKQQSPDTALLKSYSFQGWPHSTLIDLSVILNNLLIKVRKLRNRKISTFWLLKCPLLYAVLCCPWGSSNLCIPFCHVSTEGAELYLGVLFTMSPEALGNQWREYQWRVILKALPGGIIIPEGLARSGRAGEERCGSSARDMFILMGKGSQSNLTLLCVKRSVKIWFSWWSKERFAPFLGEKANLHKHKPEIWRWWKTCRQHWILFFNRRLDCHNGCAIWTQADPQVCFSLF